MAAPSSFVYLVDRYLEVSNVYHLRMAADVLSEDDASQNERRRLQKLTNLVEQGLRAAKSRDRKKISIVDSEKELGQIVTTTSEFLDNTERRQKDVLARIEKLPPWVPHPENMGKAKPLLGLSPEEFLGSFPSPSFASDVLWELASWTVCPDVTLLAARDMVHMHAVELQRHLMRVLAQAKLISKGEDSAEIVLSIEKLRQLEVLAEGADRRELLKKFVEDSVPRDTSTLFDEILPLVSKSEILKQWIDCNHAPIVRTLINETQFFADPIEYVESIEWAKQICDDLVVFGLVTTYATWYSFALDDQDEMGSFRTNILFCTRILLDEGRWQVCRDFARIALETMIELNRADEGSDTSRGTGMLTANLFFARLKCGENTTDLKKEIGAWDVSKLHMRYDFLKKVLLEEYENAGVVALKLLEPCPDTGVPNMAIQEFEDWPILEGFRASRAGKTILEID